MMNAFSRSSVSGIILGSAILLVFGAAWAAPDAPPKTTSDSFQIKVVNDTGADILVRAVSFNRNWDPPVVKKGESFTATDARHYFRAGDKVFVAYDLTTQKVIASKVVTITGPTVVTFTASKEIVSGPLVSK
jgi:hypothetical protein